MPKLTGMTWDHPRGYDPLVATAASFRSLHPAVEVTWEKRSLQDFEHYPVDLLAERYDLIIIDHPHVGAVAQAGVLLPLDEHLPAADLEALARASVGASYESYRLHDHVWALPVDAAAQVQAYRPDLLARPATRWSEVLALAGDGRVLLPLRPPHALMSLMTLAANLGVPCGGGSAEFLPAATSAEVLEQLQRIRKLVPDDCLGMDPIAALEVLAAGDRACMAPLVYGYVPYARDGFRAHRLAFADIPALGSTGPRGSALGGTGLAVSARSRHPAEASAFAAYAAGEAVQRTVYAANGGQAGHRAAWLDPAVNAPVGWFYRETLATLDAAYLRPRHPGYIGFQEEASSILAAYLEGRLDSSSTALRLEGAYASSLATA